MGGLQDPVWCCWNGVCVSCILSGPIAQHLCGKLLVAEGFRGGFCEKLLEVSPSRKAGASWPQDGPHQFCPRPAPPVCILAVSILLHLCPVPEEGRQRGARWAPGIQTRPTHHSCIGTRTTSECKMIIVKIKEKVDI